MKSKEDLIRKRMKELASKSYNSNMFCFTDFLSMEEAGAVYEVVNENDFTIYGGAEQTERVMVRFGNVENNGYEQEFPIKIIKIEPLLKKFSDALTHRDFLGAIMNLGVERSVLGDIRIQENEAYVFVAERMASYIIDGLTKVKHTNVKCKIVDGNNLTDVFKPKFEEIKLVIASERCDGIVAKTYHMSRKQVLELFSERKIFINGRVCENNSVPLREDDTVSVRGFGKFNYNGVVYHTKKEKLCVEVSKYC